MFSPRLSNGVLAKLLVLSHGVNEEAGSVAVTLPVTLVHAKSGYLPKKDKATKRADDLAHVRSFWHIVHKRRQIWFTYPAF